MIGTVVEYPTRADALRMVERFRLRLNLEHRFAQSVTLDALVDHYVEQELPQLRYGSQQSHLCCLKRWIRPRWGACLLEEIKPVAVPHRARVVGPGPQSQGQLRCVCY